MMQTYSNRRKIHLLLIPIVFLISVSYCFSQDLLVKMNGDTLGIAVIEIQQDFLVYTKTDLNEERVFTTARKKLDRIIYENGEEFIFKNEPYLINGEPYISEDQKAAQVIAQHRGDYLYVSSGYFGPSMYRDGFKQSSTEVRKLYENNPEALYLFNSGHTMNNLGNVFGIPSGFFVGWELGNFFSSNAKVNPEIMVFAGVGSLISIVLNKNGVSNIRKSAELYNEGIRKKKEIEFGFHSTENGVGLVLSF